VMAVMFDDGSTFLASCGVSRMVKHSGLSERRVEVVWHSHLTMLSNGNKRLNVGFGRKNTTRVA